MIKWGVGDTCYFIESNSSVIEARITSAHGDFCTVKYTNNGAIRIRSSRLYRTVEEAQAIIAPRPKRYNPYMYNH